MTDQPSFNWLMKPICGNESLRVMISDLREKFIDMFDQVYEETNSVLCIDEGYQLVFSFGNGENQINPSSLEGAGEVKPEDGYLPILFLAVLQKKIREAVPSLAGTLTFSNEKGEPIRLDSWPKLKAVYSRHGINETGAFETIRIDAEDIGFVDPVYRLDELGEDEPVLFF